MENFSHHHWLSFPGAEQAWEKSGAEEATIKTIGVLPLAREQNGSERKKQESFCKRKAADTVGC